ncbi:MAG TPA: arginine repressor [Actinobacteria bacterium]|jgi:transcriptional regulator of arginine metabolism|nr:arginine repressor [Actinomycetota bacterium]
MVNKKRIKDIVNIINTKKISSQEMLIRELKLLGYNVAQSTVSRDLKGIRIIKKRNMEGEEFFVLDNNVVEERKTISLDKFISKSRESIISVRNAGNIIVIKTYPGEAQGVAAVLDQMNFSEVLGTVAGDDTIICILENLKSSEKLINMIKNF